MAADPAQLHASCVALDGRAILITGPSGSGKSSLAFGLMALGASLVTDDITQLMEMDGTLIACCPDSIRGRIEARGVGILKADPAGPTPVALAIDMGTPETDRLPPWRKTVLLGVSLPLLHKVESSHFPAMILQYIRSGRSD